MKHYESTKGRDAKPGTFWEITRAGKQLSVTTGRVGSAGKTTVQTLSSMRFVSIGE